MSGNRLIKLIYVVDLNIIYVTYLYAYNIDDIHYFQKAEIK